MDQQVIEAVVKAVQKSPETHFITGASPLMVVPEGFSIHSLKGHLLDPERLDQRVTVLTAEAFLGYWNRFSTDDSVVFADERSATYTAFLDYHTAVGKAGRCAHRAVYAAPKSKEWEIWAGANGKRVPQEQFAEFIEENYIDVSHPKHAEMIEVSRNLQVKKGISFSQTTRLSDGQTQLTYNEEIKGSVETRAGSMKVPDSFTLQIPVYLGGPKYQLEAHLRYRIEGGRLVIGYDLHRPHKVIETATTAVTASIVKGLEKSPVFLGAAV